MSSAKSKDSWLNGVTVLDLSSLLPCPFAAHLLAKFGARVIKIESPNRPDPAREFGYVPPGKTSSCYREINGNKELIWLDLKIQADREKLYEMVKSADAIIEGYRPEVRTRLGIEYDRLSALNPRLVYCSVAGYDPAGGFKNRAGHDINFVSRAGILDQTRDSRGNCVMPGIPIGDYVVAYAAALRISAALYGARSTSKGCHIELSIEEALVEVQMPFLKEIEESGEVPKAGQTLVTGKYPCYRLYALEGGTFALGALEPKFWQIFCTTIEREDLIERQFSTGDEGARVCEQVTRSLEMKPFQKWLEIFKQVDCCIEPVLTAKEVLDGI
ncbi:MAG: CoA transferase [Bdellovibrionota bacterium]